jgi:hypothetical protein
LKRVLSDIFFSFKIRLFEEAILINYTFKFLIQVRI